jgi:hypothetical protein
MSNDINELQVGQQVTIGAGGAWWQIAQVAVVPGTTLMRVDVTRTDNAGRSHFKTFTAREIARGAVKVVA